MIPRLGIDIGKTRLTDYTLDNLRGDALGGIASGILMLPVAMAYSVVAGFSITAGIFGAAAFGLMASLYGGLRGGIYGPLVMAGVILAGVTPEYGNDFGVLVVVGILAGLFSTAFGLLRLGSFITYIPFPVLSGIISAMGILFMVLQLPFLFGAPGRKDAIGAVSALPEAVTNANFDALAVSAISLGVMLLWRGRLERVVPSMFVALIMGTASGILWFHEAPVVGDVPYGLPPILIPDVDLSMALGLIRPAFSIALLNAIFALLNALIVDSITGERHQPNRVLIGQGAGYFAGGLIGSMPGGSSAVTFANVRCGGRTLVAGMLAASVLAGAALGLNVVLARIPLPVLSAIVIKIGWSVVDWPSLKRLKRLSHYSAATMLITLLVALFGDFMLGILVGLTVSGLVNARLLENIETRRLVSVPILDRLIPAGKESSSDDADPFEARVGLVALPDRITVASARETVRLIGPDLAGHQIIIFNFSRTDFVDDTAANALAELINIAVVAQSKPCIICGLSGDVAKSLDAMGVFERVPREHIVSDITAATQAVRRALADGQP